MARAGGRAVRWKWLAAAVGVALGAGAPLRAGASAAPASAPASHPAAEGEDFPLLTLGGAPARFSAYRRKVTVVAVWATWCEGCIEELPYVQALARSYAGDQNVAVIAISVDEPRDASVLPKVRAKVRALGLSLPVLLDASGKLEGRFAKSWFVSVLPALVVVDARFHVWRETGFEETPMADYLAAKRAVVERARGGGLP